jgi:hypothetical protein
MALAPFAAGDMVVWRDDRGRRVGRFVRVVPNGPRRGAAEVEIGGSLGPARAVRVPVDRLVPVKKT